jgi:hypothetical protein
MQGAKAMATTDILGLFATPEQYQAQQAEQERARALQFASMTPLAAANYNVFLGSQQLGRGIGGLLGAQDPQLRMISQRQQLMQSINPADPKSLMTGIQRAAQSGDQELAMKLTDFLNKQGGLVKPSGGIQEAARINAITEELATLDPDNPNQKARYDALVAERTRLERAARAASGNKFTQMQDLYAQRKLALEAGNEQDVQIIDRLINSLAPEKGDKSFESIAKAERIAELDEKLETLKAENKVDTAEYRRTLSMKKSLEGDKAGAPIKEIVLAEEIAKLDAFIRNAKDPTAPAVIDAKTKAQLYRDAMKRERPNLDTLGLAKGGKYDGQPVFLDETSRKTFVFDTDKEGKQIEIPYTGGLKGLKGGTEVKNVLGATKVVDIPAFRIQLANATKPYGETIDAGDLGISLMNNAIKTNNFASFESARTNLAKMVDPGRLTNADIERAGVDPAVLSRAKDFISRAFTSTPSEATMKDMIATMKLIRKAARVKYDRELKVQRDLAKESGIPPASISSIFADIRRSEDKPEPGKGDVRDFNTLPK